MEKEFASALIKNVNESYFIKKPNEPTIVLFFNSDSEHMNRLKRLYENLATLLSNEVPSLSLLALDFKSYPETVIMHTKTLPALYLFLYGVPLLYNGNFNLSDIHLWIKLHVSCPQMCPAIPTPTPTPFSR